MNSALFVSLLAEGLRHSTDIRDTINLLKGKTMPDQEITLEFMKELCRPLKDPEDILAAVENVNGGSI